MQVKGLTKICWHMTCSHIHPRLIGRGQFKPYLRPGYLLWRSSDCMMETCLPLAVVRSMSIGDPVKAIRVAVGL